MNIPDSLKKLLFFRQHPETALRYGPIVDLLKRENLDNGKILEVGSGSYGIAPYLKEQITGVDTSFDEPEHPLLKQVKSSGEKIPFKDSEFDVVILSDVLEHIPKSKRTDVLNEAIRVTKKMVIVSGPFGKAAAAQDKKLADYSMKTLDKMHPYFEDHLRYGLPEVEDVVSIGSENEKIREIRVIGEYLNLGAREFLMKFFITKNKFIFYFYLKGLMFLVPLFRKLNQKPCYRTLIKIELK